MDVLDSRTHPNLTDGQIRLTDTSDLQTHKHTNRLGDIQTRKSFPMVLCTSIPPRSKISYWLGKLLFSVYHWDLGSYYCLYRHISETGFSCKAKAQNESFSWRFRGAWIPVVRSEIPRNEVIKGIRLCAMRFLGSDSPWDQFPRDLRPHKVSSETHWIWFRRVPGPLSESYFSSDLIQWVRTSWIQISWGIGTCGITFKLN